MNETWIIILYIGFWILTAIGSIAMIIWAIASRIKEKKIEKEKHNEKDLKEIYEEGKDEEIKCHFCNTKYVFTKEQVGELLTKIK